MNDFCHIHVHTHYSALDGLGKPREYVKRAKELGQPAIAITDHGTTSGIYDMQKEGDKQGVKILLCSEFYIHDERVDKLGHLVVLAKNNNGLKNIYKLQEKACVDNFYYKPRINIDMLKEHFTDLVVTSACLANPIARLIVEGQYSLAKEMALEFKELFREDFYLEIQPNDIPEQLILNKALIRMSKEIGIQLVASNDVHYTYKSDGELKEYKDGIMYSPHEVLLALQSKKKLDDEKRFRFSVQDYWLKSKEEMLKGFNGLPEEYVRQAMENTMIIANKCNARIEPGNYLPHYHTIPEGKTEEQLLRELTTKKYNEEIIPNGEHNKLFAKNVANELDVISDMGYPGYFLIVQDYINWARNNGVLVGDGRGSGAGSKVLYILGVTRLNPQRYDLLFERFLTPGRVPDVDCDFSDINKMFEYLQSAYGEESVGRIIAFGTLSAKACTRRVLSCFGHSQSLISKINGCMPDRPSFTLEEALNESRDLRVYAMRYEKEFEVIKRLEGVISHTSQHAGGVVIWNKLSDILPVISDSDDRSKRVVAFDMDMIEEIGAFKFDLLGLQTLEVIQRTLDNIKKIHGIDINLDKIDYEDKEVYDMLCKGDVSGVFQLSEQAAKVIEQQPKNFKDLIAINAFVRPGVDKNFPEYIERRRGKKYKIHPLRKKYLKETEGLLVYQEQFLLDCKVFAGWSLAFADKNVRKNKKITTDVELEEKFIKDSMEHSKVSQNVAKEIWKEIKECASKYSFNKSHSASYAKTSYKTAWLKCKYRKEFYASLMTQCKSDEEDKVADIIAECKKHDIKILPPDINISDDNFEATNDGIRYRLTAIKSVGNSAIKAIRKLRPIKSLEDMLERGNKKDLRKNVVENLIKAGVFDNEEPNRIKLLNKFYEIRKIDAYAPQSMYTKRLKYAFEKESMGMYLSGHPAEEYAYKDLSEFEDGKKASIAGEVVDVARIHDRKGNPMAFITISNQYGIIKAIAFSYVWTNKKINTQNKLKEGNLVEITGKRSGNDILIDNCEVIE